MAALVIKSGNTRSNDASPTTAMYDQEGNSTWYVWLDSSHNILPGSETDGFDVNGTSAVGTYATSPVTWDISGPDGESVVLGAQAGTVANKKDFIPTTPGRWLVRLTAHKYIADPDNVGGANIKETTPDEFGVVLEIQDPSILGVASGDSASIMALNERNEYDPDEGWGRTLERYLSTVSKMAGGRRIASGVNRSGATIDIGSPVTLHSDCLKEWKGTVPSLVDYQNYTLQFDSADGAVEDTATAPIFLTLHDSVAAGGRSYLLVDGIIPYDTAALGAVAGVGETLYVNDLKELSITPGTYERRVGKVLVVGADTGSVPGSIEFDGSSSSTHVHAANVFAESNNPIKAIPPVGKVGGVGQNVREWLTAVFFPFLPATLSFNSESTQEFGLAGGNNLQTLSGYLYHNDETVFTASSFKVMQGTTTIGTLPNPPATANTNTYWSKTLVDVRPDAITKTCTTNSTTTVTMADTTGLSPGDYVFGGGYIPAGTEIQTVNNATTITITQAATGATTNSFLFYEGDITLVRANYNVEVEVDNNSGGSALVTKSTSRIVYFAPPTWHAVSASAMTPAQIQAGGHKHLITSNNSSHAYATNNEYMYAAYPAAYGPLTSVKDGNGYEYWNVLAPALSYVDSSNNLSSTAVTQVFTMPSGQYVDYYVYRWNNLFIDPSFTLIFT